MMTLPTDNSDGPAGKRESTEYMLGKLVGIVHSLQAQTDRSVAAAEAARKDLQSLPDRLMDKVQQEIKPLKDRVDALERWRDRLMGAMIVLSGLVSVLGLDRIGRMFYGG